MREENGNVWCRVSKTITGKTCNHAWKSFQRAIEARSMTSMFQIRVGAPHSLNSNRISWNRKPAEWFFRVFFAANTFQVFLLLRAPTIGNHRPKNQSLSRYPTTITLSSRIKRFLVSLRSFRWKRNKSKHKCKKRDELLTIRLKLKRPSRLSRCCLAMDKWILTSKGSIASAT